MRLKKSIIIIPIVAGIGNALMAVPMVRRLKSILPESSIIVLANNEAMAEIFRRCNEVEDVIIMQKGVVGKIKTVLKMRGLKADIFLTPFPSNRWQYSLLASCSGAKRKIMHSYPKGRFRAFSFLPSERFPAQRGLHDVEQNMLLLTKLGIEKSNAFEKVEPPSFTVCDQDRKQAQALLEKAGFIEGQNPIIVHAGSAQTNLAEAKRWPAEKYGELIQQLENEFGRRIVLVEGPDEIGVGQSIFKHICSAKPFIIHLRGSLGYAAALFEMADLYVGSDSGLAHLAAAVGTPAVTLFGPADPERVCPFGQRGLVVQAEGKKCAPCNRYPWETPYPQIKCRENTYCIHEISLQAVMEKVHMVAEQNGEKT